MIFAKIKINKNCTPSRTGVNNDVSSGGSICCLFPALIAALDLNLPSKMLCYFSPRTRPKAERKTRTDVDSGHHDKNYMSFPCL